MQFPEKLIEPLAARWDIAAQLAIPQAVANVPTGWISDLRVEENLTELVILLTRCLQYDQLSSDYVSRAQEGHWALTVMDANIASLGEQISALKARQSAIPAERMELKQIEAFRAASHGGRTAMISLMQDPKHNIAQGLSTPRTAPEDWRIARAVDELTANVNAGKADEHSSRVQSLALDSSLATVLREITSLQIQLEAQVKVRSERAENAAAPNGELNFIKRALMYQKLRARDLAEAVARAESACRGLATVFGWKTAAPAIDELGDATCWARETLYDILRLKDIERTTTVHLDVRRRSKSASAAAGQEILSFEIKEEDLLGTNRVSLVRLLGVRAFLGLRKGPLGEHCVLVRAPAQATRAYALPVGCVGFPKLADVKVTSVQPACEHRFGAVPHIDERWTSPPTADDFMNASPLGTWQVEASGLAKEEVVLELEVSYVPL